MGHWLRSRLTYANVMATLAVFLVLSGGTAVALSGSNTVFSDDIVDNEVKTADVRNDTLTGGGLGAADLKANSVGTSEVALNSLSGGDINESSLGIVPNADKLDGQDSTALLDSCPSGTSKLGRICVAGSDNQARNLSSSIDYCAGLGFRLPSLSEAVTLAKNHAVPGIDVGQYFWTDAAYYNAGNWAFYVSWTGSYGVAPGASNYEGICVTYPSN